MNNAPEHRLGWDGGCVYGLTGNPGAGKSTVARMLQELGAQVLSADEFGYALLRKDSPVFDDLVREFGDSILDTDGDISRSRLGQLVFSDEDRLSRLNRWVHPPLLQALRRRIDDHRRSSSDRPLILDAALLFEWGIEDWFDNILVVTAPHEIRKKRFEALRPGAASFFDRREAVQLSPDYKETHADVVIRNSGTLDDLRQQIHAIFQPVKGFTERKNHGNKTER